MLYLCIQRGWKITTSQSNWGLEPGDCLHQVSLLSESWHPQFQSLYGRDSQILFIFPCSFRRFRYLLPVILFFAQECQPGYNSQCNQGCWAGCPPAGTQRDEASGHMMCARVARGDEVQAPGSIQVSSLCYHWCPFRAHPALCCLSFLLLPYLWLMSRCPVPDPVCKKDG